MLRRLLPSGAEPLWRDPTGGVPARRGAHLRRHGWGTASPGSRTRRACGWRSSTRLGEAILPSSQTVLQEGDLVHVMMRTDEIDRVEAAFAKGPEEEGGRS
ncbi:Trk system potassium uptake protein TrkA OS=Streptomyces albaduncus OX=68172 GN=FHS32_001684 PE=4 SV=1 [Streptomyces griseoloalbus]